MNSNKSQSTQSTQSTQTQSTQPTQSILSSQSTQLRYENYLHLDRLLDCQKPLSYQTPTPAHDEMLFIIVHQVYELWFKQIVWELQSVLKIFDRPFVPESEMAQVVARLGRVTEIQKILIEQVSVLETMTPLDFLEFRNLLAPASGFQSFQFRFIEVLLGLREKDRLRFHQGAYYSSLNSHDTEVLKAFEEKPTLFEAVNSWLKRTPFLETKEYQFWKQYQQAAMDMFAFDKQVVLKNEMLSQEDRQRNISLIETSEKAFQALFHEAQFNEGAQKGLWRLSYQSVHAALFIQLYRDQPILHLPFQMITLLINLDENFTTWRYRHALMASRMLGKKIGTSGSSGHDYLNETAQRHRIFSDFVQLTTFFIPRSKLPPLPPNVMNRLQHG